MSPKIFSAWVLVAATTACAKNAPPSPSPDAGGSAAQQQVAPNRNRSIITHEELQAPGVISMNVLEAVRSLRPQFLTVRGLNTIPAMDCPGGRASCTPTLGPNGMPLTDDESGKVHSSIDGTKVGPLEDLTAIRASSVKEIRYLDVPAAHQKFGNESRAGPVILVVTM